MLRVFSSRAIAALSLLALARRLLRDAEQHAQTEARLFQERRALLDSEDRYRVLVQALSHAVWSADEGGVIPQASAFWQEFTGQSPAEAASFGWLDVVHPDDRERVRTLWTHSLATKTPLDYTYRVRRHDGEYRYVAVRGVPRWGPDGRFREWIGTIIDVSETRYYEAALSKSEQRYRTLAESAPLLVYSFTADGRLDYFNQRIYDYTGASPDESFADIWWRTVHPDDVGEVVQGWKAALRAGTPYESEHRLRRADGVYRWFLNRSVPTRDAQGHIIGWVGTSTDIDDQRRAMAAEHLLADASRELGRSLEYEETLHGLARLVVPQLADLVAIYLQEPPNTLRWPVIVHRNPEKAAIVQRLLQLPPPNRAVDWVRLALQSGRSLLLPVIADYMIEQISQPDMRGMVEQINPGGVILVPMVARNQTLGGLVLGVEASQRRYTIEDLALAEELARRASVSLDNSRLYLEAQQAIKAREEFLSIASHELKTPLTAMVGFTEVLQRRVESAPEFQERDRHAVQVVFEQAQRLSNMVISLLDLSRMQAGQFVIQRGTLDICALLQRVVEATGNPLRMHELVLDGCQHGIIVEGDEMRLEQVFQNLIQNALKYSPQGGRVNIHITEHANEVEIAVSDQGIGIPVEDLPHLFQRFYRAKNVDPSKITGIGLGLYVVKEIITLHGGTIRVASTEGQGSTFTVRLPIAMLPHTTHDATT